MSIDINMSPWSSWILSYIKNSVRKFLNTHTIQNVVLLFNIITSEITRVLGALCQELGAETRIYIYSVILQYG